MKFRQIKDYTNEALKIKKRKAIDEDATGMLKFHMVYTVDGVRSEQDVSAVNVQKAEELIKKQYEGKSVVFTSKQQVKESYGALDNFDAVHTIGKLNPGDKFKNRKGTVITIVEPTKDGRVQYRVGDEIRIGSENSIQNMLYANNYMRISEWKENLQEAYGYRVSYDDLIEIQGKIDRLIRKMADNHQDEISPSSNTYRIGLPFIGTREGYIDLQNMNQYIEGHEDDWDDEDDYYGESLREDLKQETPQTGEDTGLANMLIHAINGEWETISEYNDILTLIRANNKNDMIPVIEDILSEENKHIGQLQKILETISGNVADISEGEQEASEQILDNNVEGSIDMSHAYVPDDDFGSNSGFDIYLV